MIQRRDEPYYRQVPSLHTNVYQTSGIERRSVRNHSEMVRALADRSDLQLLFTYLFIDLFIYFQSLNILK